jgi:hypothetical protein
VLDHEAELSRRCGPSGGARAAHLWPLIFQLVGVWLV